MKKHYVLFVISLLLFGIMNQGCADSGDRIFVIERIPGAGYESARLLQIQTKYDRQPTGLYLPAGNTLTLEVKMLKKAEDGELPKIAIGTPNRTDNKVKVIPLKEGENIIEANAHEGGMIYFEYTYEGADPTGQAQNSLKESEQSFSEAPFYIKGKTTQAQFLEMLNTYDSIPDVTFMSDVMAVVISREMALKYSAKEDIELWMSNVEKMLAKEDEISGIVADDANPLHRPLAKGIRYLFVEVGKMYMYATNGLTGYHGDAALRRLLTNQLITTNSWGVSHELGHQHQQAAYKPGSFTETTVNIYSGAVFRMFNPEKPTSIKPEAWKKTAEEYFSQPQKERDFRDGKILGNDGRFQFFEQLQTLFGDEFFKRLHRITREERVGGGSNDERLYYLVLKTCQITGYDLRDYFDIWGFRLTSYHKAELDKAIHESHLQKPPHNNELHLVTPYEKPDWLPLAMTGITTSQPVSDEQPADGLGAINKYADYSASKHTITDLRDGKTYPYIRYGQYEWFTRNLDWDGYDGKDESTKGTVGLYGTADPEGKLYGRLYPTYAGVAQSKWCPEGWKTPAHNDWTELFNFLCKKYKIKTQDIGTILKTGGDRDIEKDGLWKKGAGNINNSLAAKVGFNALPAGVFNKDAQTYDIGDEPGAKAAFPGSGWQHIEISSGSNSIAQPNRNSRHHGSVRCVRIIR